MAHHIYQTKAFVLGGTNIGDANKFVDLFTEELGLVRAVAKSVRKETSKMRYSLQPYTFGHVSLVRGREVWRLTGAGEDYSLYHHLKDDPAKLALLQNVTVLLRRILQGEEQNEYLFETLRACSEFLKEGRIEPEQLKALEYITVLRILYSLGYIVERKEYFDGVLYSEGLLEKAAKEEKILIQEINRALKESQL